MVWFSKKVFVFPCNAPRRSSFRSADQRHEGYVASVSKSSPQLPRCCSSLFSLQRPVAGSFSPALSRQKETTPEKGKNKNQRTNLGSLKRSMPKMAGSSFHCRPENTLRRLSSVWKWFLTMPLMRPSVQNLSCFLLLRFLMRGSEKTGERENRERERERERRGRERKARKE